jgi:hypothetical protein
MHGRLLGAALLLSVAVGCAGMRHRSRAADGEAVAVDDDGIPLSATPQERERLLKSRVCVVERPTGSNIPERVCRFPTNEPPAIGPEDLLRSAPVQMLKGN